MRSMRQRPVGCSACGCAERLHDVGMKRAPGFREPVVLPEIRLLRQVAGDGSRRTTRGCRATVFGPVAACRLRQRRKVPSQLAVLPQRSAAVTRSRCSSPVGRSRSSKVCVTMPRIGSRSRMAQRPSISARTEAMPEKLSSIAKLKPRARLRSAPSPNRGSRPGRYRVGDHE